MASTPDSESAIAAAPQEAANSGVATAGLSYPTTDCYAKLPGAHYSKPDSTICSASTASFYAISTTAPGIATYSGDASASKAAI